MLLKITAVTLALLLCCAYSAASFAQSSGVYHVAVKMAKNGDFEHALQLFHALYQRGGREPKLLYNIAVCHYRLGHLTEAHDFYSQLLSDSKYKALAAYNMGLIEAKTGDDVSAIRSFQLSLSSLTNKDVALLNLNRKALRVLSKRNSDFDIGDKPWFASIGVSVAHDDNARLLSNELLQNSSVAESDTVYSSLLTAQTTFAGTRKNGYKAGMYYNALRYAAVDANSTLYTAYVDRVKSFSPDSTHDFGLETGLQTYLGYRDSTFTAKYKYISRNSDKNSSEFSYRYLWVEPQNREEYWRGSMQEAKYKFIIGELTNNVSMALRYETNHRLNNTDPLTPTSFSPNRAAFRLQYKYINSGHSVSFYYDYRASRYTSNNSELIDPAGGITPSNIALYQRHDRKKSFNAAYRFTFKRHWQWALNYFRQINSSNRTIYSYQQSVIGTEFSFIY